MLEVAILLLDFVAMLQTVVGGETVEGALADEVGVELAVVGCVDGDEEVGHDAAAAVYGATTVGLVFQRVGELDAVSVEVFAVFEALGHFLGIFFNTSFVGTLDAAA